MKQLGLLHVKGYNGQYWIISKVVSWNNLQNKTELLIIDKKGIFLDAHVTTKSHSRIESPKWLFQYSK